MATYATLTDLYRFGAPEKAFASLDTNTKLAALEQASTYVDTFYRGRYSLPLLEWDIATTEATCQVATYNLLSVRGFNPASGADVNIVDRFKMACDWLDKVQRQQAHPNVVPQPDDTPAYRQPTVISSSVVNLATGGTAPKRGW